MTEPETIICCGCLEMVSQYTILPQGHLHGGEPICVGCNNPLEQPLPIERDVGTWEGASLD